ncbi:hypothetical protein OROGR_000623 [Orobanche gracilis]
MTNEPTPTHGQFSSCLQKYIAGSSNTELNRATYLHGDGTKILETLPNSNSYYGRQTPSSYHPGVGQFP